MTTISILCTMCGAAALSRGILRVIEYIGRLTTAYPFYIIFCVKIYNIYRYTGRYYVISVIRTRKDMSWIFLKNAMPLRWPVS